MLIFVFRGFYNPADNYLGGGLFFQAFKFSLLEVAWFCEYSWELCWCVHVSVSRGARYRWAYVYISLWTYDTGIFVYFIPKNCRVLCKYIKYKQWNTFWNYKLSWIMNVCTQPQSVNFVFYMWGANICLPVTWQRHTVWTGLPRIFTEHFEQGYQGTRLCSWALVQSCTKDKWAQSSRKGDICVTLWTPSNDQFNASGVWVPRRVRQP